MSALVLHAALLHKQAGGSPFVLVTTSDTLVESPEVTAHFRQELAKMEVFAREHNFRLETKIVQPNLASTWQVKILTGRGLPSYAGTSSDCSIDLKSGPQISFRRRLSCDIANQGLPEVVTCPAPGLSMKASVVLC